MSIIITAPDGFSIRVVGIPAPQGSKRYVGRAGGKGVLVESSARAKPWRAKVTDAAAEAWAGQEAIDAPIVLTAIFAFSKSSARFSSLPTSGSYSRLRAEISSAQNSTLTACSSLISRAANIAPMAMPTATQAVSLAASPIL